MLESGRYIYVVFMCHLALEKALKGICVQVLGEAPPRTHNLLQLLKLAAPDLRQDQVDFLSIINTASIATRYPEDLGNAINQYSNSMTASYLTQSEEVISCLHNDPRLS